MEFWRRRVAQLSQPVKPALGGARGVEAAVPRDKDYRAHTDEPPTAAADPADEVRPWAVC